MATRAFEHEKIGDTGGGFRGGMPERVDLAKTGRSETARRETPRERRGYVSDEVMCTLAPIVVYCLYAEFFQLLLPLDNYRLHTRKEEDAKNSVPLGSVVKGVLLQQVGESSALGFDFDLVCYDFDFELLNS
ncbi:hypothetical protein L6452_17577 [Arctium lappa]|uniref:Uncharacterized protein n=1 Tax=Arctium lappa TaxID=4217 RepID=A0ACB9C3T2_ARCLA|nr:hypothetical protein L6452_17577 [Arctium lappa]